MARFPFLSFPFLSLSFLTIALGGAEPRAQCTQGAWETPFDHQGNAASGSCNPAGFQWSNSENAIHMSLIPKGPRQGWIVMWPHDHYAGNHVIEQRYHRWALLNPAAPISSSNPENYCMILPGPLSNPPEPGKGDLFCAGHAWTANGDLLVVGGTGTRGVQWGGSTLAYLWRSPDGANPGGKWDRLADLDEPRWYPSIVALGPDPQTDEDRMLIGGGTHLGTAVNSYQVWRPTTIGPGIWQVNNPTSPTPNIFPGPLGGASYELGDYPRLILMSGDANGDLARVMTAGMVPGSDRVGHYTNPGIWLNQNWQQASWRIYGTSVLLPISPGGILKDWAIGIGGEHGGVNLKTAQVTNGGGSGAGVWSNAPPMAYRRKFCNSVLMPDSTLIVFGGEQQWPILDCSEVPALVPERYDLQTNQWTQLAADEIVRTYHSTALLLPSGKALTAAGDRRKFLPEVSCSMPTNTPNPLAFEDYRVFVPGYLNCGQMRPVVTNAPAPGSAIACAQGGNCGITYQNLPFPLTVAKVVLLRQGSVTHHADTNQRCVELNFSVELPIPGGSTALVTATIPTKSSGLLPRGYYMLFLVTNERVPSQGVWVKVE